MLLGTLATGLVEKVQVALDTDVGLVQEAVDTDEMVKATVNTVDY